MSEEEIIKEIEYQKSFGTSGILPRWAVIDGLLDLYNKEKEKNGILQEELDKKVKALDMAMSNPDYISKDKIREKIKWYEEACKHLLKNGIDLDRYDQYQGAIEALQELLEESE